MRTKFLGLISLFVFLLFFSGSASYTVNGYRPIYAPVSEVKIVKTLDARDVETQGKIYVKDNYIYIGDVNRGVHVVNNSNPENPVKECFIQIYGNHDIAIKGNMMYADNVEDLIVIDISDIQNPVVVKRIEDVYTPPNQFYPENVAWRTHFECVDPEKGYVVGWVWDLIVDPECYTTY